MSLIAEITLSNNLILFEDTFEESPEARCVFEDFHYVTDEDKTNYVFFWWMSGEEPDDFEDSLRKDPTVPGFRAVVGIKDRHLYRVETVGYPQEQPLVFPIYRKNDITEIESVRDADGLHLKARFPSRDTLSWFIESGEQIADDVEVRKMYVEKQNPEAESGDMSSLTPKQRDVLSVALEHGYFDTPSRTTLGDLADEFDVSPQTLSTHIRVGVRKVVKDRVGPTEQTR
ncbi:MAG: helix-turn-helix domain-containing protein [Halobacteriales archaeon]|nr:helix-turn-helix domain-containing protein [Halobacteriales archaeon]